MPQPQNPTDLPGRAPDGASRPVPNPRQYPQESRGSHTSYIGWSPKVGRSVCFGSRMEFFHWLLLEGDPEVLHLCEYYPSVQLENREFVFDMWVRWRDGRQECREVVAAGSRDLTDWAVLVHWARDRGYGCRLVTEQQLAGSMKRINNWRRMLPFVKYAVDNPDAWLEGAVLQRMRVFTDLSMRELVRVHPRGDDTAVTAVVAKLLHSGKLSADLDTQHFGPNLMLHLAA